MEAHHLQTIDRLTERFKDDPRYPAIIIGGSLVKGRGLEFSDVDAMFVASDEEYARCEEKQDFWYVTTKFSDYPGGYVDGKIINLQFLQDAADHGSEPARAAFVGAFPAYSRIPGLDELIKRIPVYQEADREEKIKAFYSEVLVLNFYVSDAEKRNMRYLMAHAASEMVFYAARLLLAYNRILYPYHKWLMYEVERAPEKPANFMELADKLLQEGSVANAQALWESLNTWHDWGIPYNEGLVRFIKDAEWNWRDGRAPLQDW
ncbi:MAG TPA: hypothetical protein VFN35_27010 [Ktedonobacteraceae bacterium]|nr:hypothetical protein [Ktedonobacteraceae bacterium]